MQQEDSRRREKIQKKMWEKLHRNILMLCKALLDIVGSDETHAEVARRENESETSALDKKRNAIATELGINFN